MAVNFNDDTWKYVSTKIEESIKKQTEMCTNASTSYKEVLQAQAKIAALRTILNLPQVAQSLAATRGNNVN